MESQDVINATLTTKLNEIAIDVKEIKEQTKLTNGRVGSLENWKWFITGGLAMLSMLFIPLLLKFLGL